jgi:hypothetical protein
MDWIAEFARRCARWASAATMLGVVALAGCGQADEFAPPSADGWHAFEGSWNAAGSRRSIPLGEGRRGSIIELRGTLLLVGPGRPGVGFHAETIALVDTATGLVGRGVLTDERGDQVYTEVTGEGTAAQNRITATILGGSGRYAGATGGYEFSWQFMIEADDGAIQGRAVGLKGRVRLADAATEDTP